MLIESIRQVASAQDLKLCLIIAPRGSNKIRLPSELYFQVPFDVGIVEFEHSCNLAFSIARIFM